MIPAWAFGRPNQVRLFNAFRPGRRLDERGDSEERAWGFHLGQNLAAMMGGRIWVESQPGQGSIFRFTVRLPLAAEPPAEAFHRVYRSPHRPSPALRILVVEDNPSNQKLDSVTSCGERGHIRWSCRRWPGGVHLRRRAVYDAILDGRADARHERTWQATAAIRREEAEAPSRADHRHDGDANARRRSRAMPFFTGMDGYLSKPIEAREMISLVESLVRLCLRVICRTPSSRLARPRSRSSIMDWRSTPRRQ